MSIIRLKKITVYGLIKEKESVLSNLQELGCLHIIPLSKEGKEAIGGASSQAREALKFLLSCPNRRHQVRNKDAFNAEEVQSRALALQSKIRATEDERDFLYERIATLRPFGEFQFMPIEDLNNLRLWFYAVPHNDMSNFQAINHPWAVVNRDNRFTYVVVISEKKPENIPVDCLRTGNKSPADLRQRLEDVQIGLEDLQAERVSLTRWCDLFAQNLNRLEDNEALTSVTSQTYDDKPLFALQAWALNERIKDLREFAQEKQLALVIEEPAKEEMPPTLLRNPSKIASGQDLVTFYMTPAYWLWDPSILYIYFFIKNSFYQFKIFRIPLDTKLSMHRAR